MEDHLQDTSDIEMGRNVIAQESIAVDLEDLQAEEREFEQSLQYEHDADDPLLNLQLVYFVVELVFFELSQYFSQLMHRLEVADGEDQVLEKDKRCVNNQRVSNVVNFQESDDLCHYKDSDKKSNKEAAFLEFRLDFDDFFIDIVPLRFDQLQRKPQLVHCEDDSDHEAEV